MIIIVIIKILIKKLRIKKGLDFPMIIAIVENIMLLESSNKI